MTTTHLTWTRNKTTGEYVSGCGRFRIARHVTTKKAPAWVVTYAERRDPVCPQYPYSTRKYTLKSAMKQAQRWSEGKLWL